MQSIQSWLVRFSPATEREADRVATGFCCFFSVLASYYLVLPVRHAAAVSLGTDALPKLFGLSLGVTLVTAPAASAFLGRSGCSRPQNIHRLFSSLAICLVAHWAFGPPGAATIASTAQSVTLAALYLWLSAANLVAVSVMWVSVADAFDAAAAARLFGFLAAGATSGQLAGSAVAGVGAVVASRSPAVERGLPIILLLGSSRMGIVQCSLK